MKSIRAEELAALVRARVDAGRQLPVSGLPSADTIPCH
jgi:hypothetical protein